MLFTGFNIVSINTFLTNQINKNNSILYVFYQRKSYFPKAYLLSLTYTDDILIIWLQTTNNQNYISLYIVILNKYKDSKIVGSLVTTSGIKLTIYYEKEFLCANNSFLPMFLFLTCIPHYFVINSYWFNLIHLKSFPLPK